MNEEEIDLVKQLYVNGYYNIRELAEMFKVSRMAIWRSFRY
ncbi:helix-turn-helix domain-containing protein [Candidatus Micrarchaeota archaeon]|nr:helix-turn-helix domain-containing protein [Candidatus Micrarchaeota archaeon]